MGAIKREHPSSTARTFPSTCSLYDLILLSSLLPSSSSPSREAPSPLNSGYVRAISPGPKFPAPSFADIHEARAFTRAQLSRGDITLVIQTRCILRAKGGRARANARRCRAVVKILTAISPVANFPIAFPVTLPRGESLVDHR